MTRDKKALGSQFSAVRPFASGPPKANAPLSTLRPQSSVFSRSSFRRGNALIMAVALTTMLAIIGASFVMVTRIETRGAKSFGETLEQDTGIEQQVLADIATVLAADVVSQDGNEALDRLFKTRTVGAANYAAEAFDGVYNYNSASETSWGLMSKDPWLAPIEPEIDPTVGRPAWRQTSDLWDIPYLPNPYAVPPETLPSGIMATGAATTLLAEPVLPGAPAAPLESDPLYPVAPAPNSDARADADGDGIVDSFWRLPRHLQNVIPGKNVFVALRIIDNCGLLNLNTAWGAGEPLQDNNKNGVWDSGEPYLDLNGNGIWDSPPNDTIRAGTAVYNTRYGDLPTQADPQALLRAARPNTARPSDAPTAADIYNWMLSLANERLARLGSASQRAAFFTTIPGAVAETADLVVSESVLRYIENIAYAAERPMNPSASLFGYQYPPNLVTLFDITDELELRNRFCLNTMDTTPIERMWPFLGTFDPSDYTKFNRLAPYGEIADVAGTGRKYYNEANWWYALTGNIVSPPGLSGTPARDLRHLITVNSFDRAMRPRLTTSPANEPLNVLTDPVTGQAPLVGELRSVDVNRAATDLLRPMTDPRFWRGAKKLVHAIRYAGYTADEAVQYVANLRDYLDADGDITVFQPGDFPAEGATAAMPTRFVFGFERQPFISEVFSRIKGKGSGVAGEMQFSAVELCNPYDTPISLNGHRLIHSGGTSKDLAGQTVPAATPRALPDGTVVWRPGRLVVTTSELIVTQEADETETNVPRVVDPTFKFKEDKAAELRLVRTAFVPATGATEEVLLDVVIKSDMEKLTEKATPADGVVEDFDIQRGLLAWRFARNRYNDKKGIERPPGAADRVYDLGLWESKTHPEGSGVGVAMRVADRIPLPMVEPAIARVRGWFELGRPMILGNVRDSEYDESDNDKWPVSSQIGRSDAGNSSKRLVNTLEDENKARFDLAGGGRSQNDKASKLFEALAFFSRSDDDADNNADLFTDDLNECRVPGRINVNTAPVSVLRAAFPRLLNPQTGVYLTDDQVALASDWLAQAIDYERRTGGPFVSLPHLFRRLAELNNSAPDPSGVFPVPAAPRRTRAMWYGTMLGTADNNPANLGDPYMTYLGDRTSGAPYDPDADSRDYEERDWILGQVANILTVRSDTFTAYILIRTQDATPTGGTVQFRDKRLVAIFDRSNVFLPPALANNGSNDSGDAASNAETAAMLTSDPNYRDRDYVRPRIVAIKDITD